MLLPTWTLEAAYYDDNFARYVGLDGNCALACQACVMSLRSETACKSFVCVVDRKTARAR